MKLSLCKSRALNAVVHHVLGLLSATYLSSPPPLGLLRCAAISTQAFMVFLSKYFGRVHIPYSFLQHFPVAEYKPLEVLPCSAIEPFVPLMGMSLLVMTNPICPVSTYH